MRSIRQTVYTALEMVFFVADAGLLGTDDLLWWRSESIVSRNFFLGVTRRVTGHAEDGSCWVSAMNESKADLGNSLFYKRVWSCAFNFHFLICLAT